MHRWQEKIAQRKAQSLYRMRRRLETGQSPRVVVDGQQLLAFSSNDYLGLANDQRLKSAFKNAVDQYGTGMGASALMLGYHSLHRQLEERLADFLQRSRVLLFSTGYMANLGVISTLAGRHDVIFQDKLNHASLVDAGQLSRARVRRYQHNDTDDLRQKILNETDAAWKLVVTDGMFSMDGDLAPIKEINDLVASANNQGGNSTTDIMVDDAHGLGVVGEHGRGILEQAGLGQKEVAILVGTFGKSFGTFGAFVAGSEELIETLIQYARTYIYTTAPPPATAAATIAALEIIETESWRRQKLLELIQRFRTGATQLGLQLSNVDGPIQPVMLGSSQLAVDVATALSASGIHVVPVRPPTVPENTARLRISISAAHEDSDIDLLLEALSSINPASFAG